MHPIININICAMNQTVSSYFLFNTVLTVLSILLVSGCLFMKQGYGIKFSALFSMSVALLGLLGCKLMHFLIYYEKGSSSLLQTLAHPFDGYVTAGAFILVVPFIMLITYKKHLDVWVILDILTPGTALGLAFSKVGCYLTSCCFGLPTNLPWAVVFPIWSDPYISYGFLSIPIHPVQLYESFFNVLLFLLSLSILKYSKKANGIVFLLFFALYHLYRAIIASIRFMPTSAPVLIQQHPLLLNLSFLIVALISFLLLFKRRERTSSGNCCEK